ncbi:MAG: hypothetical protein ACAH83_07725 [Alphaproteobacteria bacterium]
MAKNLQKYIWPTVYWSLFTVTSVILVALISDTLRVFNASPEELKNWPFGSEMGWSYCSVKTYLASGFTYSYVGIQNLVASFLFYRLGHQILKYRAIGIAILLLPLIFGFCFGEE